MAYIDKKSAIDALKAIRYGLWEIDIPSPTVPEYVEHHEQIKNMMEITDGWIKRLEEQPAADVVEKERYDRLLENATIMSDALNEYQTTDVPEKNDEKWVPVTERLPEKDGMYLVSISPSSRLEKRVDTDFYSHFGIWQIFGNFVTAWRELPEPWEGGADVY